MTQARIAAWMWLILAIIGTFTNMEAAQVMTALAISQVWFAVQWLSERR